MQTQKTGAEERTTCNVQGQLSTECFSFFGAVEAKKNAKAKICKTTSLKRLREYSGSFVCEIFKSDI